MNESFKIHAKPNNMGTYHCASMCKYRLYLNMLYILVKNTSAHYQNIPEFSEYMYVYLLITDSIWAVIIEWNYFLCTAPHRRKWCDRLAIILGGSQWGKHYFMDIVKFIQCPSPWFVYANWVMSDKHTWHIRWFDLPWIISERPELWWPSELCLHQRWSVNPSLPRVLRWLHI